MLGQTSKKGSILATDKGAEVEVQRPERRYPVIPGSKPDIRLRS